MKRIIYNETQSINTLPSMLRDEVAMVFEIYDYPRVVVDLETGAIDEAPLYMDDEELLSE